MVEVTYSESVDEKGTESEALSTNKCAPSLENTKEHENKK